jgi:molybdopterin converting factor small subunit
VLSAEQFNFLSTQYSALDRMMLIKVEILPWLSSSMRPEATSKIELEHQLSGSTVRDLAAELSERDDDFARVVFDQEEKALRYPALVAVNDQLLEFLKGLDTELHDGDTVTFMAAYTGG